MTLLINFLVMIVIFRLFKAPRYLAFLPFEILIWQTSGFSETSDLSKLTILMYVL